MTTASPARIPTDVQTSVIRCFASASIVILSCVRATFIITRAVTKFIAPATMATRMPGPRRSSGTGSISRCTAETTIATAATMISAPSTPLEKYSALSWPYACRSSAGCAASVSAPMATRPAARLTSDSSASDHRLTEPVRKYAPNLSTIVPIDVAIDSRAMRRTAFMMARRQCFNAASRAANG